MSFFIVVFKIGIKHTLLNGKICPNFLVFIAFFFKGYCPEGSHNKEE